MMDQKYEKTKKRVEEIKGFYIHLIAFICVIIGLFIFNLVTTPGEWWFYWLPLGWPIGIYFHGMGVFYFR